MIDYEKAMLEMGYSLQDDGDCIRSNALYRGGANPTSICLFKNSGVWKDYGGNSDWRPFKELVELTVGENNAGQLLSGNQINAPSHIRETINKTDRVFSEDILDRLLPHYDFYTEKRGIDINCLRRLRCGLAMSGKLYQRLVFPIFDEHKNIHGFSGRSITARTPKWKHLGNKAKWVYPAYTADFFKESFDIKKQVILVESIGDMLALNSNRIENVLVSFGISASSLLIAYLISLEPDEIVIAFNADKHKEDGKQNGFNKAVETYLKLTQYFDPDQLKISLPLKTDFGDMNSTVEMKKWVEKTLSLSRVEQRAKIKELAPQMAENKQITKESLKGLKRI